MKIDLTEYGIVIYPLLTQEDSPKRDTGLTSSTIQVMHNGAYVTLVNRFYRLDELEQLVAALTKAREFAEQ